MINTLKMALKIDLTYAINANAYQIKRLPIFRNIFNGGRYDFKLKKFARVLSILLSALRFVFYRLLYFFVLYYISSLINSSNVTKTFIYIYFIFTFIGMFINNNVLSTNKKKYFSIILFNMDAKKFMKATFVWSLFLSLILNCLGFLVLSLFLDYSFLDCLILILFSMCARVVGEVISVFFYKKKGYLFTANYKNTLVVLFIFFALASLPFFNIFISNVVIYYTFFIFLILSVFGCIYLMNVKDYKLIYKKLFTEKAAISSKDIDSYAGDMVQIKDKDKYIASYKLSGKKGYDLFNTIFFERHREILIRSSRNTGIIAFILIVVLGVLTFYNKDISFTVHDFILNRLGWFVVVMYIINKGSTVTQAMFYNCDHAMLKYNFYREPDVIISLFKKRLFTLIKINLLPAIIIGIGFSVLLAITGGDLIINYITIPLFIIVLSIFFSVHYLVMYYLIQPYNKNLEMKSFSYTFVSFITCVICYLFSNLRVSSLYFSIFGIIFTIGYIVFALKLVYRKAPITFKIKS